MKKGFILIVLIGIAASCFAQGSWVLQSGVNYRNLDINQVDAYYGNTGRIFYDRLGGGNYEVPKGSGKNTIFSGGIWFSGKDNSNNIYTSVDKYRPSNTSDFYPGPLKADGWMQGTTSNENSASFDYIWKISREEIILHQLNYQNNDYVMPDDFTTWPAHGNVSNGYAENLAPFVDVDNNGAYEPSKGDYPKIKGDMSLYWIFNDNKGPRFATSGLPLGIEIHAQAYAFDSQNLIGRGSVIDYTTFLEYKVINRSKRNYHDFSTAFWTDVDIGYAFDDYIGTNVELNSMYTYNGNETDGSGSGNEYGENPPAQFITVLDAPQANENDGVDNDNDGTIDEEGEKLLLANTVFYNNDGTMRGDPTTVEHYYNYMRGLWKDNRPITFGGTGYIPSEGGIPAKYMFPGESDPWMNGTYGIDPNYPLEGGWTEGNENNAPRDRRGMASCGTFNLDSGEELDFIYALVWSRGRDGAYSSVNKGFAEVAMIKRAYEFGAFDYCKSDVISVQEITAKANIRIVPNPIEDSFVIEGADKNSNYQIYDLKGQILKSGIYNGATIDISNFHGGLYILKISSGNNLVNRRIIKLK